MFTSCVKALLNSLLCSFDMSPLWSVCAEICDSLQPPSVQGATCSSVFTENAVADLYMYYTSHHLVDLLNNDHMATFTLIWNTPNGITKQKPRCIPGTFNHTKGSSRIETFLYLAVMLIFFIVDRISRPFTCSTTEKWKLTQYILEIPISRITKMLCVS